MSDAIDPLSPLRPEHCPAYILCGGQSARFGTDKARIRLNQQPHLLRLADSLREQGHAIYFVSSHRDRYLDLGITALVDARPDCGPMAGLVSAAQHLATTQENATQHSSLQHSGWFLLVSCDQLRWQANYFHSLASRVRENSVAVTYGNPLLQPIPGLYNTRIQPIATLALAENKLSLKRLLESLGDSVTAFDEPDNPRRWCFNSESELNELLTLLGLTLDK